MRHHCSCFCCCCCCCVMQKKTGFCSHPRHFWLTKQKFSLLRSLSTLSNMYLFYTNKCVKRYILRYSLVYTQYIFAPGFTPRTRRCQTIMGELRDISDCHLKTISQVYLVAIFFLLYYSLAWLLGRCNQVYRNFFFF